MPIRVLIVEQVDRTREAFVAELEAAGMHAFAAKTMPEAAELMAKHGPHVVVLDLLLMSGNAVLFMAGVLGAMPNTRVIATTASGAMRQASTAVAQGAFDYLVKPIHPERLRHAVQNAVDAMYFEQPAPDPCTGAMFGQAQSEILRMASSTAPTLVEGEAGTCKLECAKFMHMQSHRARLPLVSRACGAFGGSRLKDLFSPALLRQGGTLYLEDANLLSLRVQTQLLRFLQTPVFDEDPAGREHINVRIILGVSANLEADVDAGRFREDLFYRLKVVRIVVAPLRERIADIPALAQAMIDHMSLARGQPSKTLAEDAGAILARLSWPGNHGQMQAMINETLETQKSKVLRAEMLPEDLLSEFVETAQSAPPAAVGSFMDNAHNSVADLVKADWSLADLERLVIELAISQNGGSVPKAAKQLSVSPSTLYRKRENWPPKTP